MPITQLIKLELKKTKLGWYVKGSILASLIIAGLMLIIGFEGTAEEEMPLTNFDSMMIMGILMRGTMIVMASVLLVKLIIEEFKMQTMMIMYTYPISRRKLMTAKLLLVAGLTFMTTILSHAFVAFVFFSFNNFFQFIPGQPTLPFLLEQGVVALVFALAITGTSLLPLYVGMRNYSGPAAIVTSIIIAMLVSSYDTDGGIGVNILIPLPLAVAGLLAAWSIVRRQDKLDV